MLHHIPIWWLLAIATLTQAPAAAGANGVLPGLSYLPPRPDNTLLGVGTPAIAVTQVTQAVGTQLPSLDLPALIPPAAVQPAIPLSSYSEILRPVDPPPPKSCFKACSFNYAPVCGSDGVTYTNDCTFSVATCRNVDLVIERVGPCASGRPSGSPSVPTLPSPPPPPPSPPAPGPAPVVIPFPQDIPGFQTSPGSGVIPYPPSFGSLGTFTDPGASDPLPTPSLTSVKCPEACTKIYIPLCGTDGVTYNNKCLLDIAACRGFSTGLNIDVAFEGTCESLSDPAPPTILGSVDVRGSSLPADLLPFSSASSSCDKECTKIFNPVCGTDDNSYNSPCLLEVASCESVSSGGSPINVGYEGHCVPRNTALFVAAMSQSVVPASFGAESSPSIATDTFGIQDDTASLSSQTACPEECTKIFTPVCGSDDQTYNNECILNIAACKSRSSGGGFLFKAFDGPCVAALPRGPVCDRACEKTFLPVCGSDGETYNNICLLNLANCLTPFVSITHARDGPCGSVSSAGLSTDPRPSISIIPIQGPTLNHSAGAEQGYLPPV